MTLEAKRADVREVAFAATFGYRNDVVGIPQAFAKAGTDAPFGARTGTGNSAHSFEMMPCGDAIDTADGANTAIALQDFLAEMTGVGAELPFLDAPIRAKREAAFGYFQIAVAAQIAAVLAFGQTIAVSPAARHGAYCAHVQTF
jgi:hypothetical protein